MMKILETLPQLENLGLRNPNRVYWQLNTSQLYEEIIRRHEAYIAHLGPLVVRSGHHTSLAHDDRFIVAEAPFQGDIAWGEINRPFDSQRFNRLQQRLTASLQGTDIFVQDCYARTDTDERLPIRVVTETAWHSLFIRNSYVFAEPAELEDFVPEYTIIHAPGFRAVPKRDGTNSDAFVLIHLSKRLILIGGTSYAGEIKKAIFSVMNYMLPRRNTLSMECAANVGDKGDVLVMLGAFGTGKTTLAINDTRTIIGDSEHGWSDNGIFSIGRGCYVNIMNISAEDQPDILATTRHFGTILENVAIDVENRQPDLSTDLFTTNTRASYPITHLKRVTREGVAGHPQNIVLLTMDAFGVIPPVSKLTPQQAQYHFLAGYSSELEEMHDNSMEPMAVFSACYGAPFMPLHPGQYARLFSEKITHYGVNVWLVNTGWVGGPYKTGKRIPLSYTRSILDAIVKGKLNEVETRAESYFGLHVPVECPGIPSEILYPADAWKDKDDYAMMARELARDFDEHFAQYADDVDPNILAVQPHMG